MMLFPDKQGGLWLAMNEGIQELKYHLLLLLLQKIIQEMLTYPQFTGLRINFMLPIHSDCFILMNQPQCLVLRRY